MKKSLKIISGGLVGVATAVSLSVAAIAAAPFGNKEDTDYATALWAEMAKMNFVGKNAIQVKPFEGSEPHGTIQQVLAGTATVNGHTGRLLVKRNHGGKEDLTVEEVYDNPTKYFGAVTVMFKREAGYDKENKDWFWAKYKPDGTIDKNPKGLQLAGRVAKGKPKGCIACHTAAGGEDLETLTEK